MLRMLFTLALAALLSTGLAQEGFTWSPDQFPEGDQTYVLQVTNAGDAEGMTLTIEIVQGDAGYDVTTTIVSDQTGLAQDDLGGAAFGGSMMGGLALGPMLFYGPMFMMLPLMLGQEEIRVRTEPMVVMGMRDSVIAVLGERELADSSVEVIDVASDFRGPVVCGALLDLLVQAYEQRLIRLAW